MTKAKGDGGKGLYMRRRSGQRDMEQGTYSACMVKVTGKKQNEDQVSSSGADGYDNADVMMAMSVEELLEECRVRGTEGFTVKMQSGKIKVIKGSLVVLSGTRRANCVYTLDGQAVTKKTLKGRKQLGEYQTGWNIKTGNVLDFCNQRSTQQCTKSGVAKHLGVAGLQQQNGLVKETNVTLLAKVRCFLSVLSRVLGRGYNHVYISSEQGHHHQRLKTPIDMLGFFGWLASIKQGMLEPVKVKCIFLGYRKGIVGNKLWRLDDVTSKVVLYRNMGFNESGEYKKTFIGFGVGKGSVHVLQGVEFEVEPQEVEPHRNVDHVAGSQEVHTQDLIYYHLARDREQHSTHELFSYREDSNEVAFAVATVDKIYAHKSLTFNNTVACEVISKWKDGLKEDIDVRSDVTKGLLVKAKGNVLGMEIVRDQNGNTLRVSQSKFYNEKLVQTLLEGHFILSLEGSLSGDYDVEKNGKWSCIYVVGSQEYQMVCTRLDIASADVGMLDKFDSGLQTDVQALSPTEAGYMTLTEAAKEAIGLKGLANRVRNSVL
ncbi:hypothetical protein Tco_0859295 [Tanacetum coccineum]|uniref:Zinc finger, CCHC-type n=1 Tax=Tanacetum coccineum TaxID=301880 RepID=A0ABQ5BEK4_9ASTR